MTDGGDTPRDNHAAFHADISAISQHLPLMSDQDLVETKIFRRLTEIIETLAERLSKELEQMIHMLGQERSDLSELLKTMESRIFGIEENAKKRIEAAEAGEEAANDRSAALTDRNNDVEREVAELRPELASVYSEKASLKGSATDKAANLEDQLNMAKLEHAIETTSLQRQVDFHQENTRIAREEVASLRKRLNDATKDAEKRVELANSRADEATERADEANKRVTDAIKDVYKRVELANERADAAINEANRRADEANDASKHADEATTEANRRAEEASKRAEDASRHAEEVTAEANKRADEASKRADEANERAVEALNFRLAQTHLGGQATTSPTSMPAPSMTTPSTTAQTPFSLTNPSRSVFANAPDFSPRVMSGASAGHSSGPLFTEGTSPGKRRRTISPSESPTRRTEAAAVPFLEQDSPLPVPEVPGGVTVMVYDGTSHTAPSAMENVALRDQFVSAINGLNQYVKDWQDAPTGRITARCAWLAHSKKKKNEVGDEKVACPVCRKKGRICVRTEVGFEPTIVPLSAELHGDLPVDDVRFWRTG